MIHQFGPRSAAGTGNVTGLAATLRDAIEKCPRATIHQRKTVCTGVFLNPVRIDNQFRAWRQGQRATSGLDLELGDLILGGDPRIRAAIQ